MRHFQGYQSRYSCLRIIDSPEFASLVFAQHPRKRRQGPRCRSLEDLGVRVWFLWCCWDLESWAPRLQDPSPHAMKDFQQERQHDLPVGQSTGDRLVRVARDGQAKTGVLVKECATQTPVVCRGRAVQVRLGKLSQQGMTDFGVPRFGGRRTNAGDGGGGPVRWVALVCGTVLAQIARRSSWIAKAVATCEACLDLDRGMGKYCWTDCAVAASQNISSAWLCRFCRQHVRRRLLA